ncbi:MAG TPA: phage tail protein [Ruminiclostridium sp.]|nr:phage tail protein [Ruminiclostridium sp.]
MAGERKDPFRNYRFKVQCEGLNVASFSDVSGFDAQTNSVDYREGDETLLTTRKLPGLAKYGNITLKKGVIEDLNIYNWAISMPTQGKIIRRNLTITLMDEAGTDKASWQIENAWPVKYSLSEFKAQGNEVMMETLELTHEGMTRTK